MAKTLGRPSKYRPKYCKMIEEFFEKPQTIQVLKRETIKANGTIEREYQTLAAPLPTVVSFSLHIGVDVTNVRDWAYKKTKNGKFKYPDFHLSYTRALAKSERHLVNNALAGLTPPASFVFVAKNYTKMRDKQEVDVTSEGKQIVAFNYLPPGKNNEPSSDDQTNT